MIQDWLGFTMPSFPGDDLVAPIFGTAVFLYGGLVFLQGGLQEARARRPGMMLLIALALIVAFAASRRAPSVGSTSSSGGSSRCSST